VATRTNQAAAQRTHRLFQGFPRLCKSSGTPHACIHRFARGDEKALARQTEWPESEKKSRKSQLVAHGHVVRGVFESAWFHGRGAEAPTSSAQLSNQARPGPPSQPCSERPATAAGRRWGVRSRLPKGSMPWPRLTSCDCCIAQGPVDPCEGRLAGACSSALDVRPYAQQPAWRARKFGRHRIAVSVCGVRTAEASNKPCRLKTTGLNQYRSCSSAFCVSSIHCLLCTTRLLSATPTAASFHANMYCVLGSRGEQCAATHGSPHPAAASAP
jgi:hypothetical protein